MIMPPGLRKLALTVHITVSVGWIGGVIAYLCLVIAAISSQDAQLLRAVWTALELIAWYGLAPLAFAALLTGLIMALGTKWGLLRHYWVLISLLLTIFATIVLLTQLPQISAMANLAAAGDSAAARQGLAGQLLHAGVGLVVLLVIQVLNVYKPRGITRYGWRKQQEQRMRGAPVDEAA
jgi:hypothetical protein